MGVLFQLILLTFFYYVGLLLFQNRRTQQLERLQKEVIGKTKPIELSIPPKEEIFGATSKPAKEMPVQSNDIQSSDIQTQSQSQTIPSEEIMDPITPNRSSEPLKARELLFKGTLSDTSSKEATSTTEESAIQQTVQQIIEGTSLASTELELTNLQEDSELLKPMGQQKAIATLNTIDFIPSIELDQEMNLLYFQDIPQLIDYHKQQKKK